MNFLRGIVQRFGLKISGQLHISTEQLSGKFMKIDNTCKKIN